MNLYQMKNLIKLIFLLLSISFYGQNDTISVIKHTDKDIVINKESKVVYRGMMNSLSIEVLNCKSFRATANGLTMVSKNLYNLNPLAGSEVIITVDIVLNDDKKKTEKHVFIIKNISGFLTTLNGKSGLVRFQKSSLKDAIIKVGFEDKNLSFSNKISSFCLKIPGMSSIQVSGNRIDKETYEKIQKKASLGDQIVISDIKLIVLEESLKGGMCFKTSPIVIEVY